MEQLTPEKLIEEILQDPRLPTSCFSDPGGMVSRLAQYCRIWEKWNRKISLTAEREIGLFIRNHLFLSLQFCRALEDPVGLADIGSGAGLPGIPLKITLPGVSMALVECRRKRANFIKQVVRELSLEKIEVFDSKVEDMGPPPFIINTVVFRAVSETNACLQMAHDILKPGGSVVLLRTADESIEIITHPAFSPGEAIPIEDYYGIPLVLSVYNKKI